MNGDRPSVFLDCASRQCNQTYFRTELPWVNWVRQPQDADVHLIMTSQSTGAGGRAYQLDFIGTDDYEYEHQLLYQAPPTGTERETLDEIAHTIGVGVLHFATLNGFFDAVDRFHEVADILEVDVEEFDPTERVVTSEEVDDPWSFWVFRLGGARAAGRGADPPNEERLRQLERVASYRHLEDELPRQHELQPPGDRSS